MPAERAYWFRAKRYGWGWGLPTTWQGWMVLVAFVVLLVIASIVFPPHKQLWPYVASVAVCACC
jgi:lipoprotein signal peptidase